MSDERSPGDAGTTSPIQDRSAWRRPLATFQFAQHVIPFPTDPLSERLVIALEIAFAKPVILDARSAIEEGGARALESAPVDRVEVHEAKSWAANDANLRECRHAENSCFLFASIRGYV